VTNATAPNLDDLNAMSAPAWLWDGDRLRVVWANPQGLAFFGCKSLYDLIDMPFDERDPGVARVRELAGQVQRGESWQELICFAAAESAEPFSATMHVHSLADGRRGLLMVGEYTPAGPDKAPAKTGAASAGAQVIETLPAALMVLTADGTVELANAAARDIWGGFTPDTLGRICNDETAARLLERAARAGVAAVTADIRTNYSTREFRLLARRLGGEDTTRGYSLMLDDITDRRALERIAQRDEASPVAAAEAQGVPARSKALVREAITSESSARLDEIRAAIEAAGIAPEPASDPVAVEATCETAAPDTPARPATVERFDVNPIVRKALGGVTKAVVLYRGGKLIFANTAAARLLGHDTEDTMASRHGIATAIAGIDGASGETMMEDANGVAIAMHVEKSTFPWNDGAMPLAILTAAGQPETIREGASQPMVEAPAPAPEPAQAIRVETATAPEADASDSVAESAAGEDTGGTLSPSPVAAPVDVDELFSILDTASDGIVFLSDDGDITYISAGAEALFGVHAASVIDTPLAALMDKTSARTVRDYIAALGERGLSSLFNSGCEVTARMKDGGEVPLFLAMRRIGTHITGIPASAYCAVLRDITQWKKNEAELREARDRAEASSRQKSEFLARMSHELRTPLNAILGFSEVMRKGEFGKLGNERYEGYANDIHTSGEYLLSLVNDLLDLSKVEAGKLDLNFTSVDLGAVIEGCLKLMQNEATGARVVLRKSISDTLPHVVADQRSVKQVVLNLVSNAIKFTDPGGQVIVAARMSSNGELVLSVSDTGVGMSEEQLSAALEPFSRIETSGREVQGTGLGLPLTKALVEANRAQFSISSEPRKGTRVDITFPTTRVLAG
jgi:PAS domain S-box-containing protein